MESKTTGNVRLVPSTRFGVLALWFYGSFSMYLIRTNFGVSIVCMTYDLVSNETVSNQSTNHSSSFWGSDQGSMAAADEQCDDIKAEDSQHGEFAWDRTTRGLLSSAFFFGYILIHLPAGVLAQKIGPRWVHLVGMIVATAASLLCPVTARISEWALLANRIIMGLGCGVHSPTTRNLITNWSPVNEKSMMISIQSAGIIFGNVVSFATSGAICDSLGWEWTFYIPSMFMVVYVILFGVFGVSDPLDSKFISDKERKYIIKERSHETKEKLPIPWRAILTSPPCLAVFFTDFGSGWCAYATLTCGAQYMQDVLKFDITANGGYNAIPQICKFTVCILAGILVDAIIVRRVMPRVWARKSAQTLGFLFPCFLIVGLSYMDCTRVEAAIALYCLTETFCGFTWSGLHGSALEIAPRYSPIINGIQVTFSTAGGMLSPIAAALLTPNGAASEWQKVFFISAGMFGFSWITFTLFASTDEQPWAKSPAETGTKTSITTIISPVSMISPDEKSVVHDGEDWGFWNPISDEDCSECKSTNESGFAVEVDSICSEYVTKM